MRDYAKVSPQFWIGKTGKALRKQGVEALVVSMYLMTAPNANMLGLFYMPLVTLAHETGLGMEGATKGLQSAIEAGFCAYDDEAEMVWVLEMASYQVATQLKPDDKRCLGVQNDYNDLPENKHLAPFYVRYKAAFNMTAGRDIERPTEAPSKPLPSQEQEQEQKKEQEQEQKQEQENQQVGLPAVVEPEALDPVVTIFAYWQEKMKSPRSALDDKRKALIKRALKDYSHREICEAIRGCSKTPHNMGQNDRNTKFNGLNLILRDAEHIDYFLQCDKAAAKPGKESVDEMNARIEREFLADGDADDNVIEMEQR